MLRCGAKQAGLRARTQLLEQPRGAGALAPPSRPLRLEPADALGVERRPQHRLRVAEPRCRLKVEPEQRGEQRVGGAQLRGERGVLVEPPQQVAPGAQHAPQGARLVALQRRAQPARRRGECGQLRHPRCGGRGAGREHLRSAWAGRVARVLGGWFSPPPNPHHPQRAPARPRRSSP